MKGSVRKRGANWEYQFEIPPKADGKRRFATKCGFRLKSEAEAALAEALAEHQRGERVDRSTITVAQYLTREWLDLIAPEVKPSTLTRYRSLVAKVVDHPIGGARLQAVTPADVSRFLVDLRDAKSGRGNGSATLSPTTIQHVARLLSKALTDAVRFGYLTRNPAKGVKAPSRPATAMRFWEPEQVTTFLRSTADDRWAPLWALLATTGMRRGEALGLSWSALDLDQGIVAVRQARTQTGITTPKTAAGRRVIDLELEVVDALRAWRIHQLEERLVFGAGWPGGDWVWTQGDGRPLSPDSCSWWFERAVKAAGLPAIGVHGLRHSWATAALQGGMNPVLVSQRLGHAKVSITLDVYSHAIPRHARSEASRVNAAILGR